jgi:RNA polymerase sigma-70 factor (ECF subfamily)
MSALLTVQTSDYSHGMVSETPISNEAAFIARAQAGDTRAFEALYRLHIDRVYGLCLRMTGNVSEAEDCAQEAFIQAWNKLSKFRGDSAFGTWMHRIAVNSVLGRSDAIEKLPEGARHVFVLNAVYGYSHEESGNMLGIAVGTSKAQLHRARRLLAQQLQEQGFEA